MLQVQVILNEPTVGDMKKALDKVPHGLNDALGSTLSKDPRSIRWKTTNRVEYIDVDLSYQTAITS